MSHLSPEDAQRWVAGLLDAAEADALEAHARGCRDCEALLQREARVEAALARAASLPANVVPLRRRARFLWVAGPLALAAALALLLTRLPIFEHDDLGAADAGVDEFADAHFPGESPPPEAFRARSPFAL